MDRNEVFRRRFRDENIGERYSGKLHFIFLLVWCISIIVLCIANIHAPTARQWMIVPLTFLYTNLFEYIGHRFPMHHRYNLLQPVFKRHTLQHHHFFTNEHMDRDEVNDLKIILFPPVLLIFFSMFFVLPVSFGIYHFFSQNAALFFIATTLIYYLNYELLHLSYHLPQTHWVYKIPGLITLRKLHYQHHDLHHMDKYNFNISYPVFDVIFRTLKK